MQVIAEASAIDRAGELVNGDKWKEDASKFSSDQLEEAIRSLGQESPEKCMISHFNANPHSDWVYVRSCACIPTAFTCIKQKYAKKQELVTIKQVIQGVPEVQAILLLQAPQDQIDNPCLWRMAGYEEIPSFSWFAKGMPYIRSRADPHLVHGGDNLGAIRDSGGHGQRTIAVLPGRL